MLLVESLPTSRACCRLKLRGRVRAGEFSRRDGDDPRNGLDPLTGVPDEGCGIRDLTGDGVLGESKFRNDVPLFGV